MPLQQRQSEMRAHPGAHDLRRPGIRRARGQTDRLDARGFCRPQDGAQVARVAQLVQNHHEAGIGGVGGLRNVKHSEDALRRLRIAQAVKKPVFDFEGFLVVAQL